MTVILYYSAKSLCIYLFVCTFCPSSALLTNRLRHVLKILIDYSVNFRGAESIFFSTFCHSKVTSFIKNELNDLAYASRNQNIRGHSSRYVTEGGTKMLIRSIRNNKTSISKILAGTRAIDTINTRAIIL